MSNSGLYGSGTGSSSTSSSNTSGLYGNDSATQQTVNANNTTGLYPTDVPQPTSGGTVVIPGNLVVNGCSIITNCTDTFNLINTNATGVNFAGNATAISIGAGAGTTTINNDLVVSGSTTFANIITDQIGPNDSVVDITSTSGTYATLNPAGPTNGTDLTTKTYVDSAVSSVTVDRLVNGTEQFVLNADGSVTSPGDYNLAQNTIFKYSENNDRLNRPTVISTTGNTSGWAVRAPNATASAAAVLSAFNTNDANNGKFISVQARGGTTDPLRVSTGEYVAGVLQASGNSIAFRDGSNAAHATINPAGPTISTDLTTKAYVDSIDTDTTYTIDASTATGGANFNLVGSDATTDTIKFAEGSNISVVRTDANTITIAATGIPAADELVNGVYTLSLNSDGTVSFPNYTFPVADGTFNPGPGWGQVLATNGAGTLSWVDADGLVPTYSTNVGPTTGGVDLFLQAIIGASISNVATTTFLGGTNVTVSETAPNVITIAATDTNTTYTQDASATTGGANLNLVGSDATTDSVKFAGGTNVTVTATDANTITIAATDTNTTYTIDASSTSGGANLNLVGSDATTDTVKIASGTGVTVAQVNANELSVAIGQSVATSASPTFVNGTFTGAITTAGSGASKLKRAVSGATGSGYPLILNRQATGAARVTNNGPHLGFEYQGTDNTEATSPVGAIRGLYDSAGENYFEILRLAGSYTTGIQTIARLKRGDHFFKNKSGFNSLALTDASASIIGQTATSGFASILNLTKRRTDVAAPTDGDRADFRILFQGNTGSAISVGKFEGEYDATNGHAFTMNVYEATGTTSITAVSTTQKETTIAAIPTAGGTPAAVAIFNRDEITLTSPVQFPVFTTTERNALTPSAGWVIFNSTDVKLQCYDGSNWQDLF